MNHDFCAVSLSDYLTPWETIERRLEAAAKSGFAIVLYNPASRTRPGSLARACGVLLKYMEAERPCGYVANIGRDGERSVVCTLGELRDARADMFTTVFIGNEATENIGGKLVAKRGYQIGKNTDICRDDGRT